MRSLTRRGFITRSGELIAAALSLPLLAACGLLPRPSAPPGAAGSVNSGKVKIPSYVAIQDGPRPELPGRADGVDAGYFNFPRALFKSVREAPGRGEEVTLLTNLIQGAVVPLEQNSAWQAVNKDMGLTVRQRLYGSGDYRTGLNTTIAGGDLPDTLYNNPTNYIANLPSFLQAQCADLTSYIGGDAVKDYPNLANIPTPCWAETVFNGAIYAVPVPRAPFLNAFLVRQDVVDQAQLEPPKSADDFRKYLMAVARPQQNRFGLAAATPPAFGLGSQAPLLMIFGAPNNWALDKSGKLVKDFETEEYRAALAISGRWASSTPIRGP